MSGLDIERSAFSFSKWVELESANPSKNFFLGLTKDGLVYAVLYDQKTMSGNAFKLSYLNFLDFRITNKSSVLAEDQNGDRYLYSLNQMLVQNLAKTALSHKLKIALKNALQYSAVGLTAATTLFLSGSGAAPVSEELLRTMPLWLTFSTGLSLFETLISARPSKLITQTGFIEYRSQSNQTEWFETENSKVFSAINHLGLQSILSSSGKW